MVNLPKAVAMSEEEDEFSGEKSVVRDEPTAADYEPAVNWYRALAALGVAFGTVGVFMLPFGLLRFHQGAIAGGFRVAIMDEPVQSTSIDAYWLLCSSLLGAGLALALMVGGIGGVCLKSWSIVVLRIWSVVSIIVGVMGSYFYLRWLFSPARDQMSQVRGVDDVLVNFGGCFIGLCLAIAILSVIGRPQVREALGRGGKIVT